MCSIIQLPNLDNLVINKIYKTVQYYVSGEKVLILTNSTQPTMNGKKNEDFDCQNFEQQDAKGDVWKQDTRASAWYFVEVSFWGWIAGDVQSHLIKDEKASGLKLIATERVASQFVAGLGS